MGICYVLYLASTGGGDAYDYWNIPKSGGWNIVTDSIAAGSPAGYIFLLNYFPSKVLNLSFFTGSSIYMVLGYAGFIFCIKLLRKTYLIIGYYAR